MSTELPEPTQAGTVVRIDTGGRLSKYPEVWVADYINGGRWYPDSSSWAQHVRGPLDDGGAHWDDLLRRGPVVLLVASSREACEHGWRAACAALSQQADDLVYDCPGEAPDAA